MTIEESLEWLISRKEHYEMDDNCQELAKALDTAIDTMRKYQKIQDKLDQLEHEMEITLESDTRTMINRESENGWLFDKILRWKKVLEEIEGEVEREVGMSMTIEIRPKDNTVGSVLSAILDKYVEVSNKNGLPVHRIIVNDCLMYWDSEEILKGVGRWE